MVPAKKAAYDVNVKVSVNGTINYAVVKDGRINATGKLGLSAGRVYVSLPLSKSGDDYEENAPEATAEFVKALVLHGMGIGATDGLAIVEQTLAAASGVPFPKGTRGRATDKAEVKWGK